MDLSIERIGSPRFASPLEVPSPATFVADDIRLFMDPYVNSVEKEDSISGERDSFEVAGPRRDLHFHPNSTRVAIATCGGLSPGLNDVIRALVLQLWTRYGVREIYGARNGYGGVLKDDMIRLRPADVATIHRNGGSMLGTSRGGPSPAEIVDGLQHHAVDIFFPIGGDGTLRGAGAICQEVSRRQERLAVVGLPKTIDNDIPWVRRSFGFESAVRVAMEAIRSAVVEARSLERGVGLVKLMGRHAGYIAATATLASGEVDFCLVPEVPFSMEGLIERLADRLDREGSAVVVTAEGAGQEYVSPPDGAGRDASGNIRLGDIGLFMKAQIEEHFKKLGKPTSVKYIDPSYMVRSSPADAGDALYCRRLAQNAVHAAMSGRTAMYVGYWHGRMTHVPFTALAGRKRQINPLGELWWNVLESTGQPAQML